MTDARRMSAFRDVQIAMDFQKMAENGYLDEEFTMYGCVYLDNDERRYLVSSEEGEIIAFIQNAAKAELYPSPIRQLKEVCHVPLGEREAIGNQVKIRLAQKMQEDYPLEFLRKFNQWCEQPASNAAFVTLYNYVSALKNCFSLERITLAENLILLAYESKKLTADSYRVLMEILEKEKAKMQDDIIEKNTSSKTLHTIEYEADDGNIRYVTNARMEWIAQKKNTLKRKGNIVSPIYSRVYWYNYQRKLDDIQKMHKENYLKALNDDYFALVKEIYRYPAVFDREQFAKMQQMIQSKYSVACQEMLNYYGCLWQILVQSLKDS